MEVRWKMEEGWNKVGEKMEDGKKMEDGRVGPSSLTSANFFWREWCNCLISSRLRRTCYYMRRHFRISCMLLICGWLCSHLLRVSRWVSGGTRSGFHSILWGRFLHISQKVHKKIAHSMGQFCTRIAFLSAKREEKRIWLVTLSRPHFVYGRREWNGPPWRRQKVSWIFSSSPHRTGKTSLLFISGRKMHFFFSFHLHSKIWKLSI